MGKDGETGTGTRTGRLLRSTARRPGLQDVHQQTQQTQQMQTQQQPTAEQPAGSSQQGAGSNKICSLHFPSNQDSSHDIPLYLSCGFLQIESDLCLSRSLPSRRHCYNITTTATSTPILSLPAPSDRLGATRERVSSAVGHLGSAAGLMSCRPGPYHPAIVFHFPTSDRPEDHLASRRCCAPTFVSPVAAALSPL